MIINYYKNNLNFIHHIMSLFKKVKKIKNKVDFLAEV